MKNVIIITGASSGFGSLTSHALARAGHTVYAGMRETTGCNAPQVAWAYIGANHRTLPRFQAANPRRRE
jgi:NADP-dependent 3-hydroxy acid dehydrogenase YdfG